MNRLKFLKKIETGEYLEIQNATVDLASQKIILLVMNKWGDSEVIVLELATKDAFSYHLKCWRCKSQLSQELKELIRLELALNKIETKQIQIVNLNKSHCNLKQEIKQSEQQFKWLYLFETLPLSDELTKQLLTCPRCQAPQDFVMFYSAHSARRNKNE